MSHKDKDLKNFHIELSHEKEHLGLGFLFNRIHGFTISPFILCHKQT